MTRLIVLVAVIAIMVLASGCLTTAETPEGEGQTDTLGDGSSSDVDIDDVFSDGDISPPQMPP